MDCGIPETPTNGIVKFQSTMTGIIATYECNEGCVLDGVVQRVCEGNGQWSGNVPQCKSKLIIFIKVVATYIVVNSTVIIVIIK